MAKYPIIPKRLLDKRGLRRQREFKQLKRAEMKAVLKAIAAMRQGVGYVPGYEEGHWRMAWTHLEKMSTLMSVAKWGQ